MSTEKSKLPFVQRRENVGLPDHVYRQVAELERKLAAASLARDVASHNLYLRDLRDEQIAAANLAREMLRLILPLAKGYAAEHRVGSNADLVLEATRILEFTDAAFKAQASGEEKC